MDKAPSAASARRLAASDWLTIGLAGLRAAGPDALTIDRLTAQAGRTRGSFYHHFASHEEFVRALAERWLQQNSVEPIAAISAAGNVRHVRSRLAAFSAALDHQLERQMRRLGEINADVGTIVRRADEMRIAMLVGMFESGLGLPPAEALKRAQLQHMVFVGVQIVFPDASIDFRRDLDRYLATKLWV
jgi:AcrR family transcriptional regulator